jgi:vacuolar protein sorting-associated protein 53
LQTAQAAPAATLSAACHCVDVLGPEVRSEYVEKYVALELKEYKRIFSVSTKSKEENEAAGLDNLSRRYELSPESKRIFAHQQLDLPGFVDY